MRLTPASAQKAVRRNLSSPTILIEIFTLTCVRLALQYRTDPGQSKSKVVVLFCIPACPEGAESSIICITPTPPECDDVVCTTAQGGSGISNKLYLNPGTSNFKNLLICLT